MKNWFSYLRRHWLAILKDISLSVFFLTAGVAAIIFNPEATRHLYPNLPALSPEDLPGSQYTDPLDLDFHNDDQFMFYLELQGEDNPTIRLTQRLIWYKDPAEAGEGGKTDGPSASSECAFSSPELHACRYEGYYGHWKTSVWLNDISHDGSFTRFPALEQKINALLLAAPDEMPRYRNEDMWW